MSPNIIDKLVREFAALPAHFSEEDLDRVIINTLDGVPLDEWEAIADKACDRYCDEGRDRTTLFLFQFKGSMH